MIRTSILSLALLTAGCAAIDSGVGVPRQAGSNLVGEACSATAQPATGGDRLTTVQCGNWEQPSARVLERGGIAEAATAMADAAWRATIDSRMRCDAPRPTTFAGELSGLIAECRLLNGGFPTVTLAIASGDRVFLADTIPAALPVVERVVQASLGRGGLGAETIESRAVALIRAATGRDLTGANALDAYYNAIAGAQYQDTVQNFAAAEDYYRRALIAQANAVGQDDPGSADPLMHVALELSNQGRFEEAAPLFDEAERLAALSVNSGDLPRLYSYRAIDAANQDRLTDALAMAERATAARRAIIESEGGGAMVGGSLMDGGGTGDLFGAGGGSDSIQAIELAQSLHAEAALRLRLGDPEGAEQKADEALATVRAFRAAPPWWLPQFLETRAMIAAARGESATAAAIQGDAVVLWRDALPGAAPEGFADLALGQYLHAAGRTDAALDAYRAGFAILGARGAEIRPRELIGFLYVAGAVAEAQPDKADALHVEMFQAMQLMRSGITSRTVSLATARLAAGDQEVGALIRAQQENERRRYAIVARMNSLLAVPAEIRDVAAVAALRADLAAAETEGQDLDATLQAASTGYRQLLATPVKADELQGQMKAGEALVAFASSETTTYGFLVMADRLRTWRIDAGDRALGDVVLNLRRGITPGRKGLPRFPVDLSHQLYLALFGPVADDLKDVTSLVTTANGPLASIPFSLLVAGDAGANARTYADIDWMVRHQALAMVPSVRAFADLRRVGTASGGTEAMVGFGDYRPPQDLQSLFSSLPDNCVRDRRVLGGLGALPNTASELRRVAGLVGAGQSDLVLGADFTKPAVLGRDLSDYRIVYFATHAVLASEIRCFAEPALLVTPAPGEDADSALLKLSDILNLHLDADLVVLSACNTGGTDGKSGGEALSGLARAFFYAGARRLVVSHWPVPDTSTANLMVGLFDRRVAEVGGAVALQRAQVAVIDGAGKGLPADWSHPLFWAGFSAIGDGTGISPR